MSHTSESSLPGKEPETDAEYQVAIRSIFEAMARVDKRMVQEQIEIDRLRAETRAMIDELPRMIAR